ncbi:MAG: methylmalonyl-CoA mutase family protein, partial [Acidobacteria bacterium]|nr:methylmalonyl-CoA mutase family protein [Acidobacteriota bacterium]
MKKHLMTPEDCRESDKHWQEKTLEPFLQRAPERLPQFTSLSGNPVKRLYTPADVQALDYQEDLGYPGQPPYTRGIHPTMYRGKLWTMRQFSGFGTSENTNARFHYLLEQGQSGLSVAFHLPTLMGLDSDHPMAE